MVNNGNTEKVISFLQNQADLQNNSKQNIMDKLILQSTLLCSNKVDIDKFQEKISNEQLDSFFICIEKFANLYGEKASALYKYSNRQINIIKNNI